MDSFVAVGRLMRTHGIYGDILCKPLSHDFDRHSLLKKVYLETTSEGIKEAFISHSEAYGFLWKFRFEGFNSPEVVQPFVNAYVLIPETERLPLPEGEFYFSDFENFEAVDKDGNFVGKVLSAEDMPSVNVFNLLIGEKEVAVPWIDDCVLKVDMEGKKIVVNVEYIQGLV
ncbi:MAG: ribosome maturation factor RimM [Fibromonadaceae bacterium]|jgi:16S rRNA processing protein RimM|nr:ribosome maturation factor RimM [Fibromonadaceae bacterium]